MFEAILVANAVFPIEGLPAIIIKSDCSPPIFLSKSANPVFKPTTTASELFLNAFSA